MDLGSKCVSGNCKGTIDQIAPFLFDLRMIVNGDRTLIRYKGYIIICRLLGLNRALPHTVQVFAIDFPSIKLVLIVLPNVVHLGAISCAINNCFYRSAFVTLQVRFNLIVGVIHGLFLVLLHGLLVFVARTRVCVVCRWFDVYLKPVKRVFHTIKTV